MVGSFSESIRSACCSAQMIQSPNEVPVSTNRPFLIAAALVAETNAGSCSARVHLAACRRPATSRRPSLSDHLAALGEHARDDQSGAAETPGRHPGGVSRSSNHRQPEAGRRGDHKPRYGSYVRRLRLRGRNSGNRDDMVARFSGVIGPRWYQPSPASRTGSHRGPTHGGDKAALRSLCCRVLQGKQNTRRRQP